MQPRSARRPADNEVRVIHADEVFRVLLVNISTTGARLNHIGNLPQDALVTLRHLYMRIPAYVAWSNDEETAVRFATPLTTREVDALCKLNGKTGVWASLDHQDVLAPK